MRLAVCLYKYFAYGGLARDFRRILELRRDAGDKIDVYCIEWHGDEVPGFNQIPVPVSGWTNHARMRDYYIKVKPLLEAGNYDLVIGFNKMPGLDLYYAADPCYLAKAQQDWHYPLTRYFGRVKFYADWESAVFGPQSHTVSMMISDIQRKLFERHYATPPERLVDLPPGIDPNRKRPANAQVVRSELRQQLGIEEKEWLLLMVGTGFKTKGVDRAIVALATLPDELRTSTKLCIIGEGETSSLQKLAAKYGIDHQVMFLGGRTDVPRFLLAADLLVHPARKENTGTVILEAIVAGLPVLVSDVCGYAKHVTHSQAGRVLTDAGNADQFAEQLTEMLDIFRLQQWSRNALDYASNEALYSMPQKAAAIIREIASKKQERKGT